MKAVKFAALPLAAVMALGACADAEPEVPEDPTAETVLDVTSDTPESVQDYNATAAESDTDMAGDEIGTMDNTGTMEDTAETPDMME